MNKQQLIVVLLIVAIALSAINLVVSLNTGDANWKPVQNKESGSDLGSSASVGIDILDNGLGGTG